MRHVRLGAQPVPQRAPDKHIDAIAQPGAHRRFTAGRHPQPGEHLICAERQIRQAVNAQAEEPRLLSVHLNMASWLTSARSAKVMANPSAPPAR